MKGEAMFALLIPPEPPGEYLTTVISYFFLWVASWVLVYSLWRKHKESGSLAPLKMALAVGVFSFLPAIVVLAGIVRWKLAGSLP